VRAQAPPPRAPPTPAPWHRDRIGGALAGAAILTTGLAAGFLIAAGQANGAPAAGDAYGDWESRRLRAERRLRTGRLLLVGGAVLAAGAAGRYLWLGWAAGGPRLALGARL
jgi:hypothetical protein